MGDIELDPSPDNNYLQRREAVNPGTNRRRSFSMNSMGPEAYFFPPKKLA